MHGHSPSQSLLRLWAESVRQRSRYHNISKLTTSIELVKKTTDCKADKKEQDAQAPWVSMRAMAIPVISPAVIVIVINMKNVWCRDLTLMIEGWELIVWFESLPMPRRDSCFTVIIVVVIVIIVDAKNVRCRDSML